MRETIGQFKILERIGAGGLGEVYRARDMRGGRTVAIKQITPALAGDAEKMQRLRKTAKAVAALSHPNVAALYEMGEDQEQPYLAFEYVRGQTLKSVIGGRPLNARRALDLAIQLADALAEVHAQGVIHGDIRPDNVIVTPKGSAKLLDCGFAEWTSGGAARGRAARAQAGSGAAAAPELARLAPYLSPEHTRGEAGDYRSDIFSLGAVLFEMLTGQPPRSRPMPSALARRTRKQPGAAASSTLNALLPAETDAIVARCLATNPDDRCQSAATIAAELRSLGAMLDVRTGAGEPPDMVAGEPERSSAIGWAIVVGILVLAGGILWLVMRA
jgi:serine/threonine-protein kinase